MKFFQSKKILFNKVIRCPVCDSSNLKKIKGDFEDNFKCNCGAVFETTVADGVTTTYLLFDKMEDPLKILIDMAVKNDPGLKQYAMDSEIRGFIYSFWNFIEWYNHINDDYQEFMQLDFIGNTIHGLIDDPDSVIEAITFGDGESEDNLDEQKVLISKVRQINRRLSG